jgi:hypothetical protein
VEPVTIATLSCNMGLSVPLSGNTRPSAVAAAVMVEPRFVATVQAARVGSTAAVAVSWQCL